jgi:hypothetical protein
VSDAIAVTTKVLEVVALVARCLYLVGAIYFGVSVVANDGGNGAGVLWGMCTVLFVTSGENA